LVEAITIPKLGLTMKKATVVIWHKREGDAVKKDEVIAEIETDKVTCQIQSTQSGVLLKILGQKGSIVPVGEIIAYVGQQGEKIPESVPISQPQSSQTLAPTSVSPQAATLASSDVVKRKISPRAKRLVEERRIDPSKIVGSGPEGMVLESDVAAYIETNLNRTAGGLKVKQVISFSAIRRAIAENMTASLQGTAQVTLMLEADATNLQKALSPASPSDENHLTYTDLLVKHVSRTLESHPIMNSTIEDNQIKIIEEINIGVGIAAESGLVVPVIRNSNRKSIDEISVSLKELGEKARNHRLTLDDVSGGTFTISNLGMYGISSFTPIINPPQTAILGVGQIALKPQVNPAGVIEVLPLMMLSLTFDHRAMDGHTAASFLRDLKKSIESTSS
jgi:pyruvate dehydrogenase E2 component (dihydrolipoamide acetyltransferase)